MQLKDARTQHQLTQEELAEKIGVSRPEVSRWEAGICTPYPVNQKNLEEALGVSLSFGKSEAEQEEEKPSKDRTNTYFVAQNTEEVQRLQTQAPLLYRAIGGFLPEIDHPEQLKHVLDVGCGTGLWVASVARTYLQTMCIGIDISPQMINAAKALFGTLPNTRFIEMDALKVMLAFHDQSFDLVNQRLGMSWLRLFDWKRVVTEYLRIVNPGGFIRIVESDVLIISNSDAIEQLRRLIATAFHNAGHIDSEEPDYMQKHLAYNLIAYGLPNVQSKVSSVKIRSGTPEAITLKETLRMAFHNLQPFLEKYVAHYQQWMLRSDAYEAITRQALQDIDQPGFEAHNELVTCWCQIH